MGKFEHVDNGEWVQVDEGVELNFACCDCALVHELRTKIENGKMFVSFTGNNYKTGAMRRHYGVPAIKRLIAYSGGTP